MTIRFLSFSVIIAMQLLIIGCAATVSDLRKSGKLEEMRISGKYDEVARCALRNLEHENPTEDGIARGLGDDLTFRNYPRIKEAEIFGPSTGWIIYISTFRQEKDDIVHVKVISQDMFPYTAKGVNAEIFEQINRCAK